jgi:sRNA-binding carbon storage regulator CsrA
VGEGFSIGDDWHFHVAKVNARFVTLDVTNGSTTVTHELEVEDSLHISTRNTLQRRRAKGRGSAQLSPVGVRVARVTSNDARLAVHAPRSLKILRHEHDTNTGVTRT